MNINFLNIKFILGTTYLVIILIGLYFLFSVIDIKDLMSYEFIRLNKDIILNYKNENFLFLTISFFIFSIFSEESWSIFNKIDFALSNSCFVIVPRSYIPSSFTSCAPKLSAKLGEQINNHKIKAPMIFFILHDTKELMQSHVICIKVDFMGKF